jgi:hypothetical protein
MNKQILRILCFVITLVLTVGVVYAVQPEGVTVTHIKTEMTNITSTAGNHSAYAGNVTELVLDAPGVTQAWQGYFGNVTGTLELGDASGNILYNWSGVTASSGEVYAANQSGILWTNIECLNVDNDSVQGNITEFENFYNIGASDADGIDETFAGNNHPAFDSASVSFSAGACNTTQLFDNGGAGVFTEAILHDNSSDIPVFTSLINATTTGFDGDTYDFELIVPEDGHSGDTNPTLYYFYVELNS